MKAEIYVADKGGAFAYSGCYCDILFSGKLMSKERSLACFEALELASEFIPENIGMVFLNDVIIVNYLATTVAPDKTVRTLVDRTHNIFPEATFHYLYEVAPVLVREWECALRKTTREKTVRAVIVGGYHCARCLYRQQGKCTKHRPRVEHFEDGWRCSSWVKKWWLDGNELFLEDLNFEKQDY